MSSNTSDNKITRVSLDVLIRLVNVKVDSIRAIDPTTALIIFVYDTEYKHNIFQLCVYRDQSSQQLVWRPFINNQLGQIFRSDFELKDFVGSYLLIELADMNLQDELKDLVAKQKISEDDLKRINNGGNDPQEGSDPIMMQEYAREMMDHNPGVQGLPSLLAGLGMPGSNPFLNQFNQDVLAGKEAPPVLDNQQVIDRIQDGAVRKTDSGIYLQN